MSPKEKLESYVLLGGVAAFFLILIILAFVYHPGGVANVGKGLGSSFLGPFEAIFHGLITMFEDFFTNLWNHVTGFFSSAGKAISNGAHKVGL